MADDLDFRENVVVVNFPDESNAYEALTSVKELDSGSAGCTRRCRGGAARGRKRRRQG